MIEHIDYNKVVFDGSGNYPEMAHQMMWRKINEIIDHLNAEKAERCPACNGEGTVVCELGDTVNQCPHCNGTGFASNVNDIAEIINREPLPTEGNKWKWAIKLAHAIKETYEKRD